jgi:hypothetical protein
VFFFDDTFLHIIMVTSKTKKRKYAIETISEKMEKSGKIGEKVNFFERGVCKSTHCINDKGKKIHFDCNQMIYGVTS